jgi:hypothetical protein
MAPMLAKVCLQHVLDAGVGKDGHPRRQGRGLLRRWAADGLIGGACAAEARRRMAVLPPRCPRCRRTMPPEQTALRAGQRPPSRPHRQGARGQWPGSACPTSGAQHARETGASRARRSGNACGGCGKSAGPGVVRTAMPRSKRRSGREVHHGGATTHTRVSVAPSRGSQGFSRLASGRGTRGAARAATRATSTGSRVRVASVSHGRGRNPGSCTTSRRARVSQGMRHTGCRLCGEPLAHAAGSRGTGCVHCARPGLWGGRRVTGAFTRKAETFLAAEVVSKKGLEMRCNRVVMRHGSVLPYNWLQVLLADLNS